MLCKNINLCSVELVLNLDELQALKHIKWSIVSHKYKSAVKVTTLNGMSPFKGEKNNIDDLYLRPNNCFDIVLGFFL